MSFARGTEKPEAVYGKSLEKIRALKEKWDHKDAVLCCSFL